MPVYTYRCEECGVQFEKNMKFSDPPLVTCPECNEDALRKVYTPVGIVFKGSGFYKTDNRSSTRVKPSESSSKEKASASESDSSSSGEKSETSSAKSETKSETKSEATSSSSTNKTNESK